MNKKGTILMICLSMLGLIATRALAIDILAVKASPSKQVSPPTITPTPIYCITQPDLLSIQKEVLDSADDSINIIGSTSKTAIENIQSTTERVLWLVGVAFTLLTLGGAGGLWLAQKTSREASKSIKMVDKVKRQAQEAAEKIDITHGEIEIVKAIYAGINEQTGTLQSKLDDFINDLQADVDYYKYLIVPHEIRNQAIRLCREDEWRDATNNLKTQLVNAKTDPVSRLEIVHTLQTWVEFETRNMPELESRIEEMLKSIIDSEPERLVRLEAEHVLQTLRSRGRNENKGK